MLQVSPSIAIRSENMRMHESLEEVELSSSLGSLSESNRPHSTYQTEACRTTNPDGDEALPCVQRTRQHSILE